jgi:signal transduction histidine kinase
VSEADQVSLLQRYQRLMDIARDLASTLDLNILLNRIVQAAADLCSAEAASILLYDESKQLLFFDTATNLTEPLMRGLTVPVEGSLAGWIVTNRAPVIISDTQNDPRHFGGIAKATQVTTTSMLGVPLIAKNKVVGALETINKLSGEFTLEDQELLLALGAQAAVAIENARLFQQSDLISELVHELRTPLTSLNTAVRLLVRPEASEELRKNMGEIINSETVRLSEMTTAFLDLARLESGRAQFQARVFDVPSLLEECIGLMHARAQEKKCQITLGIVMGMPSLKADRDKIKQVILNLLSNAIKYGSEHGTIHVSADVGQDEIILGVSDDGPGIPPESLPYLFDKFYRVPGTENVAQGTGLGLSICKRIIEAHRGRIEVQSEVGKGTKFIIALPLLNYAIG